MVQWAIEIVRITSHLYLCATGRIFSLERVTYLLTMN